MDEITCLELYTNKYTFINLIKDKSIEKKQFQSKFGSIYQETEINYSVLGIYLGLGIVKAKQVEERIILRLKI